MAKTMRLHGAAERRDRSALMFVFGAGCAIAAMAIGGLMAHLLR